MVVSIFQIEEALQRTFLIMQFVWKHGTVRQCVTPMTKNSFIIIGSDPQRQVLTSLHSCSMSMYFYSMSWTDSRQNMKVTNHHPHDRHLLETCPDDQTVN